MKWICTDNGLNKFDNVSWTHWDVSNSGIPINSLGSVAAESNTVRWVGTVNGGFAHMVDTAFTVYNLVNGTFPDNSILAIAIDTLGYKWCATPAGGLVRFYGTNGFVFNTLNSTIPSDSYDAVAVDSVQNIYLGSFDMGVVKKHSGGFLSYNTSNSPMPDNIVFSVAIERTGIIWVGTSVEGVVRIDEALYTPVENAGAEEACLLYPNPVKNSLTLQSTDHVIRAVRIADVHGRLVMEQQSISMPLKMDFTMLPAGAYFLSIETAGKIIKKKVIKM